MWLYGLGFSLNFDQIKQTQAVKIGKEAGPSCGSDYWSFWPFQVHRFLKLVPVLLAIVQHKKKEEEDEQAINRQTALYTLKLLCKNFGAGNREPFIPVLSAAVQLIAPEKKEEKNVLGSALLCIAEVTSTLEALAIPQLPRYLGAGATTAEKGKCLVDFVAS